MVNRSGLNWPNILTVISATIMIAVGMLGAALSGGWAIAGLLELGQTGEWIFMALFSLAALWAIGIFFKSAMCVEPFLKG